MKLVCYNKLYSQVINAAMFWFIDSGNFPILPKDHHRTVGSRHICIILLRLFIRRRDLHMIYLKKKKRCY